MKDRPDESGLTLVGGGVVTVRAAVSPSRRAFRTFMRDRAAVGGLILFVTLLVAACAPAAIAPYSPTAIDPSARLMGPSAEHVFGTDELGRDIASRLIYGARSSMGIGVGAVLIAGSIGVLLGLISGYERGRIDAIIMRCLDAALAFPAIILALAIIAVLGPGFGNTMLAIGTVLVPEFARVVRGAVLSLREAEYVDAAHATGFGRPHVMFRVILPNALSPILVQASLSFAVAILAEAGLSFLGLGIQPPTPSWGFMLNESRNYLSQNAWYSVSAGGAIFMAVLSLNLLGDGFRDALDPRLRKA